MKLLAQHFTDHLNFNFKEVTVSVKIGDVFIHDKLVEKLDRDDQRVKTQCLRAFPSGTLIGDVARQPKLTDAELFVLRCVCAGLKYVGT